MHQQQAKANAFLYVVQNSSDLNICLKHQSCNKTEASCKFALPDLKKKKKKVDYTWRSLGWFKNFNHLLYPTGIDVQCSYCLKYMQVLQTYLLSDVPLYNLADGCSYTFHKFTVVLFQNCTYCLTRKPTSTDFRIQLFHKLQPF